jgi:4a-hydroxytetrahydrobiopterin dehydratase
MIVAKQRLTPEVTVKALGDGPFVHFDGALHASFRTADFQSALELVSRVGEVAETLNHHPDVRLSFGSVSFCLSSHEGGGVTGSDLELAGRITDVARGFGATTTAAGVARYDVAIDCTDANSIRPFWQAGLGYVSAHSGEDIDLVHPDGLGPRVWFQQMDAVRAERNRIHLDAYVPAAEAEPRVQAILDAGGVLLTDEHAPEWWVLADAEGNELCVCTSAV